MANILLFVISYSYISCLSFVSKIHLVFSSFHHYEVIVVNFEKCLICEAIELIHFIKICGEVIFIFFENIKVLIVSNDIFKLKTDHYSRRDILLFETKIDDSAILEARILIKWYFYHFSASRREININYGYLSVKFLEDNNKSLIRRIINGVHFLKLEFSLFIPKDFIAN
jgi:hypothetical protein